MSSWEIIIDLLAVYGALCLTGLSLFLWFVVRENRLKK